MTLDALDIGRLFISALGLTAVGAPLALLTARAGWGNLLTQLIFILAGILGLVASAFYFNAYAHGAVQALTIPPGFLITPLSAFFASIVYAGMVLTSIYSIGALERYRDVYSLPWLNAASAAFLIGMQVVVFAPTALIFLIAWELMSIAGYFLVIADTKPESLRAGFLYFIMTHIGFLALVAGFLILSGGAPSLAWSEITTHAAGLGFPALSVAFALLFIGFGSKAGLVPLHQWLPYAHPQAPSGSSALLSGVMLKIAVFGFLQAILLFPFVALPWSYTIIGIGLLSAFFGVVHAAVENDAKRLLAWSSIENMGLIFSGIGMFLLARTLGEPAQFLVPLFMLFVLMHILNHFAFKSGLFMAAGVIQAQTHTRDLDALGGLAQKWPFFSFLVLALSLAAAALPPLGTFFGEWAYLQALALGLSSLPPVYAAAAAIALGIIGLVGGLAVFSFIKFFSAIFLGRARSRAPEHVGTIPLSMAAPIALAALLSLLIGLVAFPALKSALPEVAAAPVPQGMTIIASWPVVALLVFAGILAWLVWRFAGDRRVRVTGTWDCGSPLTPRMEYTATGFAAPIRFFFRPLIQSKRHLVSTAVSAGNPWITEKKLEWNVGSIWEAWLYEPLGRGVFALAFFVRRLQTGVVQFYLVLVVATLFIVLFTALYK